MSVVKISKEKTAKIFSNAVGVATIDERHVFGSFMSRESAYRLMLSVWQPVAPVELAEIEITRKIPDVEVSECSVEDDSSSAISGNESPPRIQDSTTSDASHTVRRRCIPTSVDGVGGFLDSDDVPIGVLLAEPKDEMHISRSTSPPPKMVSLSLFSKLRQIKVTLPTNIHILYGGVLLAVILALLSGFMLYRIMYVQSRVKQHYSPLDFNWVCFFYYIPTLIVYSI